MTTKTQTRRFHVLTQLHERQKTSVAVNELF